MARPRRKTFRIPSALLAAGRLRAAVVAFPTTFAVAVTFTGFAGAVAVGATIVGLHATAHLFLELTHLFEQGLDAGIGGEGGLLGGLAFGLHGLFEFFPHFTDIFPGLLDVSVFVGLLHGRLETALLLGGERRLGRLGAALVIAEVAVAGRLGATFVAAGFAAIAGFEAGGLFSGQQG